MTDTMIPAGMTEKEYFEIHASQEEFLDWYHKQELPSIRKTKCDGGYGSLLLCRRKDQALINSSQGSPLSKLFGLSWRIYGQGRRVQHMLVSVR